MTTKLTLLAIELLGQWSRISKVHLTLGAGCMCAASLPGLAVSDLEINILDYLKNKYVRDIDFLNWLGLHAKYQEGLSGSLSDLLKNMAISPPQPSLAMKVLKDLANTIDSLQESHQG